MEGNEGNRMSIESISIAFRLLLLHYYIHILTFSYWRSNVINY